MFFQGAFQNSPDMTPEQIARKREMLAMMAPRYGQASYVGQGLGQLFTGIAEGQQNRQLDALEQAGQKRATDLFNLTLGRSGGSGPMTALGVQQPASAPAQSGGTNNYGDAIASIESAGSGGYSAVGPQTGKGRALGRYQVMDFNVGPWTKKHLGVELTPQQFLASPQAQDAVFNGEFGSYVQKYGNSQDAASVWFSGRPLAQAGNASDGYTTVPQYVAKFNAAMGGASAPPTLPMNDLYALASNPWLSKEQRGIVESLIGRQTEAADPLRQMQLQSAQMGIQKGMLDAQRTAIGLQADQLSLADAQNPLAAANRNISQRHALLMGAGIDPNSPQGRAFIATGNLPSIAAGDGTEYGLNPILGTDENGNPVLMQLGKDGRAVRTALPEGVTPDMSLKAYQQGLGMALGKGAGQAQVDAAVQLPQQITMAEQMLSDIATLRSDPYLPDMLGPVNGRKINLSSDAARVQGYMNKIGGATFMQAFQFLRGGGQITEAEGQKATQAMARLGDPTLSVADYQAALDDLSAIVSAGVERYKQQAAGSVGRMVNPAAQPPAQAAPMAVAPSAPAPTQMQGPAQITGEDDYNKLPSGTVFIGPDGVTRRKP